MQCLQCQHENPDGSRFCNACGTKLDMTCPACHHVNLPGSRFCNACGHNLAAAPSSTPPETQPIAEANRAPIEPSIPQAERRQLTVMFCDLVGSTELSSQLDPEALREVIRAYQTRCDEVVQRFDGHIAQYLGDGLLVYFGYPAAHEDDAQRAVRASLGIVDVITALNPSLQREHGTGIAVRVGIHTGIVVIGEIGGASRQEQLALGETPNVAARIQGLAQPDTVVISESTYRLTEGYFECDELGEQNLRGVSDSMAIYRVLRESGAQHRLDVAMPKGLTPLVGRESEVALIQTRWQQVQAGAGQVVLLNGEAGIGKSRLVQVLKEHVAITPHVRLECRSSPYYQNTALYPITDLLQRTMRWEPDDTAEVKLHKLEDALGRYRLAMEETVPLLAGLLSLPLPEDRYRPLDMTPQRQRQKMLEMLVAMLVKEAERQPVLFIIEDLHWTDPTTLAFLDLLMDQSATASILTLLTCRPEFEPTWSRRFHVAELSLSRLSQSQTEQMVERVADGKPLPEDVVRELIEKTDGVPLYLEELTKAVIESGVLQEHTDHYELTGSVASLAIPATLHDSLMARLDRLVTAKSVAQLGSVIGRTFSYELLEALTPLDSSALERELQLLVEAELVFQRGHPPQATYTFKHALIQDAAYQSQLKRTRQQVHQQIVQLLEARFPEIVSAQPELLAYHGTEAGQTEAAITYWQRAGQRAIEGSAHVEAIAHLSQGLTLLTTLPETPARLHQELDFQVALGLALRQTKGHTAPEVDCVYGRARELCEQLGNTLQLFPVLRGLMVYAQNRGDLQAASGLGEQLLHLSESHPAPEYRMLAHYQMGQVLIHGGKLASASTHHSQVLALYNPQEHHDLVLRYGSDLGVGAHCFLSFELWQLGYPDQARHHINEAHRLAQKLSHPYSQTLAEVFAAFLSQFCRDVPATREQAEATRRLTTEQGFAFYAAHGVILHGWALVMRGQTEAGMAEMRQGYHASLAMGAKVFQGYYLGLLAEAYGQSGCPEEGFPLLAEGMAIGETTELRFYTSELHRLQGELLLEKPVPDTSQVASCFHQALDIASAQQAKSWELRAATSLARLWKQHGKRQDAYDLLAPVYEWFTEGFDTADLQEARTLLTELSS